MKRVLTVFKVMASDYFILYACVACCVCHGVIAAPTNTHQDDIGAVTSRSIPSEESMETEEQAQIFQQDGGPAEQLVPSLPQDSDQPQLPPYKTLDGISDVDLTPQAVAEYLLLSGDFTGFDAALMDLVHAKILSPLEVARYKRVVGWEYENLLRQMLEAEANYLEMFAKPILENLVMNSFMEEEISADDDADNSTRLASGERSEHAAANNSEVSNEDQEADDAGELVGEPDRLDLDLDALLQSIVSKSERGLDQDGPPRPVGTDTEEQLVNLERKPQHQ